LSAPKRLLGLIGAGICLAFALALLATAGLPERAAYSGQITDAGVFAPEIAALAPPFSAASTKGERVNLLALRGAPVIINFWATWCEPCAVEMPELQALYEARQSEGLRVLAINLGEPAATIEAWSQSYDLTFDLLLDPQGEIAASYRLRGQPSTYVVAPDGTVTAIFYGPTNVAQLDAALAPLL
jgi:peroxiredoxin